MMASLKLWLALSVLVALLLLWISFIHVAVENISSSSVDIVNNTANRASSPSRTPQYDSSSNVSSSSADILNNTANHASNISEVERPRILQATMFFGDFLGDNQRTLQSHIEHANRWGYGNYILRREIVGAGQWDKYIFSKELLLLELIMGQLKRPREERAEWVMYVFRNVLLV